MKPSARACGSQDFVVEDAPENAPKGSMPAKCAAPIHT